MLALPLANQSVTWYWLLLGLLFSLFGIVTMANPLGRYLYDGGLGIMFDDILAGIYAGALLYLVICFT